MSGTSMASPHMAGAAALFVAASGRARDAAGVYALRRALIAAAQPQGKRGPADTEDPDPNREGLAYVGSGSPAPNTAPAVAISKPANASTFTSIDAVAFQGTATDAEDGALTATLKWTSSRDGSLGTGGSFTHTLSVGTHTITASATDSGGLAGSASVTVTVVPGNAAPTVAISAPLNGQVFPLSVPVSFQGTANDAEDGSLTAGLAWSSSLDGPLGTGGSFTATPSLGVHTITASVTDSGGKTGSASVTIAVSSGGTALAVAVTSDRSTYSRSDVAFFAVRVTDGVAPVPGAWVVLTLRMPRGSSLYASGYTDAAGVFRAWCYIDARRYGSGTYRLSATASKAGYTDGTGAAIFRVR
jgi:hypothetical protein